MYLCRLSIIIVLYFFLHHISAAGNSPALYYPLEDIAVNCGSSGNSTALDGRQWIGDIGSKYISAQGSKGKLISSKAIGQPLFPDPAPYMTARISRWQFTYTFRVTPGQKFVRLHFYPTSYRGFRRSKAVFTVKAGPFKLLSNFSASLTADALGLQSFAKEFCVNVEENQPLTITFSPSPGGTSDEEVYAFVNGIEIVSVPTGLYHTPEGGPGAHVVGKKYPFTIDKSIALEMVQRLNVGGISILPVEDTGMFREWSEDSNYLLESSVLPVTTTVRIKYTNIPTYSAPQKVYQTSWSTIPSKQGKKTLNFTWKLPADMGFRYLVRFHFCELEYEIKESDHTEFSIFINNQMAEAKANLIKWSGGSGVAVYRDYVVVMEGDRMEGKRDLLIALCPHESHNYEWRTEHMTDAILKGLEVFKLSNPDNNLAGVNPNSHDPTSSNPNSKRLVFARGGNAIATVVVILIAILNIIVYQLRILGENLGQKNISSLQSEGLCRHFSLVEVQSATNNLDDQLVIGRGGFGKVYKGIIDGGTTTVAIKRLNSKSKQGANEFWTEIEMLSNLRHKHLVSLIGYCNEFQEMILVYDYMEHGTLANHLYKINGNGNDNICQLSWEQRLKICIGAARGLDYLHTGTCHGIIHRDVKTTNILLDEDWAAKISDFGLCKMGTTSHSCTHVSTDVKGTFGYLDPTYFLTRRLTKKSDVYAFGVVLLEVLCGRPAVDLRLEEEQHSLVLWAQHCIKEEKLDWIIDPSLREKISSHCLKIFAEVANKCLHNRPNGRPTMAGVVSTLEFALASQVQCGDSSTKEDEAGVVSSLEFALASQDQCGDSSTKEDEEGVNVGGVDDEQNDENIKSNDALQQGTDVPSPSTPVQHQENMPQGKKRSKGMLSRMYETSIALLAKVGTSQTTSNTTSSDERNIFGNGQFLAVSDIDEAYPNGQILSTPNLRIFSFSELKIATRYFSTDRVLGEGSFGLVYKGWLDEKVIGKHYSGSEVAVKKLKPDSMKGFEEWQSEVNFLARLSHPNLVQLLGYCCKDEELLIVYECMQKASLEKHLYRGAVSLPWDIRFKILIGAARGLAFLHELENQIIHRDFHASHILLDGSYNAKITGFGLAKLGPSASQSHVTTRVMGTYGYAAPEYIATGHLYVKSDVYGFGVVLLEMLTGLRALDMNRPSGQQNLVDWVKPYLSNRRKLKNIMDSRLEEEYTFKAALQTAQLALKCLGPYPKTRPSMREVVETLERIEAAKDKP